MKFRSAFLLASILAAGASAQTPAAAPQQAAPQQATPVQPATAPSSNAPVHGSRRGGGQKGHAFSDYDANHDGVIDRTEVKGAAAQARFERADLNKDGRVTADEARAARRSRKSGGAATGAASS